jgi:DNA polymerase
MNAAAAYASRTLGRFVPDEGPLDAPILVIGDVPWTQEANLGRPFAGQAGKQQDIWWREVGLERSKMRLINLYPYQPARNDVESVPIGELVPWISKLHERIAEMPGLRVIVTLGNYATFALTGKGQVKAAVRQVFSPGEATVIEKKAGISKLRGSVYRYRDLRGREIIVVPITHPSTVMCMQKWEKRTVRDWQRVARILRVGQVPIERRHIVSPDEWQVADFARMVEANAGDIAMATDIETWGSQLSCVGFALSPTESITIPLIGRAKDVMMPYVKRLCESAAPKILCNGMYDAYWLAWYGIWLANFTWDVQLMHHAIDPAESHSLDFLASIYCDDYRYWKDEGKDGEEVIRYSDELEALWVYNGLDCCYTRELLDCIYGDLYQQGLVDFYFRHYQALLDPLLRTSLHGFRVDKKAQKSWAKQLRGELEEIHGQLVAAAGEELFAEEERCALREPTTAEWQCLLVPDMNGKLPGVEVANPPIAKQISKEGRAALMTSGLTYMIGGQNAGKIRFKVRSTKKDFSKDKLIRFFYETLGLPKQFKLSKGVGGKKRTVSLDEGSIRKMTAKWPDKIGNWGNLLLAYREKKKELDYLKGSYDGDGRIRCSYKMLTEAGRLSSSTNPRRTGYNLQNIKR